MSRTIPVLLTFPEHVPDDVCRRISSVDPHLEVTTCAYQEDSRLRTARGRGALDDSARQLIPTLTEGQRVAFGHAEVVFGWDLPLGLDEIAPALRWVQAIGAGTDHLWGTQVAGKVIVTNAAGVAAVPIAEFVIGRLLSVWKRFDDLADLQRSHTWKPTYGSLVAGKTLGVIGMGAIGTAVAERARALGMRVLSVRRRVVPSADPAPADEVRGPEDLLEVLSASDAVVVCAPSAPDTANLIDDRALRCMRPDAILCNVARGALVDEAALIAALEDGHLRAAIIDVAAEEPLPPESPLWEAPRILISPHSAAALERYMDLLVDLFADNLGRYVRGDRLRNEVQLPRGY